MGGRLLPLFLVALFLAALGGALANLAGPGAYLPRLLLLGAAVSLGAFLFRSRRELFFLFVQARKRSEPGPATTWILAAVVLLASTALLERNAIRIDATARKLHSLSEASLHVLRASETPLELIAVYRENSPQRDLAIDLLEIYRASSRRVSLEVVDPDRRPDRARELGIQRGGAVLVRVGGVTEEVVELTERSISLAILRAENPRRARIAFAAGHGERQIADGSADGLGKYAAVLRASGYDPFEIRLIEEEIPSDVAALAVVGPRRGLLPSEVDRIRAYLDRGGRMLICLDPGVGTGLERMLRGQGVLLDTLEISDESPSTAGLGLGPRAVVVTDYASHPITEGGLGTTVFPGARAVGLSRDDAIGLAADVVFWTGAYANLLDPGPARRPTSGGGRSRRPLAVSLEWEVPGSGRAREGEPAPEKPFGRMLIVGDSDWLSGGYLDLLSNRELAVKTAHWLTRREFLLKVAPLDRRGTPLRIGLAGMRTLFYLLQVVLPLSLLGIGVWQWSRRR